jgi:hypothetical protein
VKIGNLVVDCIQQAEDVDERKAVVNIVMFRVHKRREIVVAEGGSCWMDLVSRV